MPLDSPTLLIFCAHVAQRFYIIFADGAAMKYNRVFYLSGEQTC